MFYCTDLLRKNDGKFAAIWLAAVYGKNIKKILTRRQITAVNITQACTDVVHPTIRFSLRLQSNLMLGILRVYNEQVSHFCDVIKQAWRELRVTFHVDTRLIDLQKPVLSEDVCTLPDPVMHGHDFPVFSSDRFRTDDLEEFIRVGFYSPAPSIASSSPHTPMSPGPHQTTKEKITMTETTLPGNVDEPIKIPGGDDMIPPTTAHGDEEVIGQWESPGPEHDEVQIIDKTSGLLRSEDTERESRKRQLPFPEDMVTPGVRIEPVVPGRPRKRRKRSQPVDKIRKLSDERIKRNHLTVSDTLRDEIIDLPLRLSAQELLNNPSRPELRSAPFINMWRENAVPRPIPDEEVPEFFSSTDESPEVAREGRAHESSFENSGSVGVSIFAESTPGAGSPTPARGSPSGSTEMPRPGSDLVNYSSILAMETIEEVPIDNEIGEPISPIPETVEEEDESFEHELQSHLAQVMGQRDQTSFSEVFPPNETRKARAAKGLFQLLEWHRCKVVVLSQPGAGWFSEIYIERGHHF